MNELDENILGEKILKEALKAPFKRLLENAGYDSGEKLAELEYEPKLNDNPGPFGFDVINGVFCDMIKEGIIDPTSVPIQAIKTAISVSTKLSSLGGAITLNNEEKVS